MSKNGVLFVVKKISDMIAAFVEKSVRPIANGEAKNFRMTEEE